MLKKGSFLNPINEDDYGHKECGYGGYLIFALWLFIMIALIIGTILAAIFVWR